MATRQCTHSVIEDIIALITGTIFVALGVFFLQVAGISTGGIVGATLLVSYSTDLPFGLLFILLNLPFYLLAWYRFGMVFTLATFIAASSVSLIDTLFAKVFIINTLSSSLCGILAGLLMGLGMLILFRHRASLGGFNVLALYLQERGLIAAGKIQLLLDAIVLALLAVTSGVETLFPSLLSVLILNTVLMMNHKEERYCVAYQ